MFEKHQAIFAAIDALNHSLFCMLCDRNIPVDVHTQQGRNAIIDEVLRRTERGPEHRNLAEMLLACHVHDMGALREGLAGDDALYEALLEDVRGAMQQHLGDDAEHVWDRTSAAIGTAFMGTLQRYDEVHEEGA